MFGTLKRAVVAPQSIIRSFLFLLGCVLVPWSAASAQTAAAPKTGAE